MIAVGSNISIALIRNLLGMIVGQVIPNGFTFASLIPAPFYLIRRTTHAPNKIRWKSPMNIFSINSKKKEKKNIITDWVMKINYSEDIIE